VNAILFKVESAEDGGPGEFLVGPGLAAIATLLDNGDVPGETGEVIEEGEKVGTGH
jgi:hypothetical protein